MLQPLKRKKVRVTQHTRVTDRNVVTTAFRFRSSICITEVLILIHSHCFYAIYAQVAVTAP